MRSRDEALVIDCEGEHLAAILTLPPTHIDSPHVPNDLGIVVVVGGPQYRVGSHRQFRLLATALGEAGYPVMRFDVRGMGDSTGDFPGFEHILPDIGAAIDHLQIHASQVRRVVLWGLCDGASAALLYCFERRDPRISGLCLLNPWVRSPASLARTHLKHYYLARLRSSEFWGKLMKGQIGHASARGLLLSICNVLVGKAHRSSEPLAPFQQRMAKAWADENTSILLILSGFDYTSKEFLEHAEADAHWRGLLIRSHVTRADLTEADHTFSNELSRIRVEKLVLNWLPDIGRTASEDI